MHGVDPRTGETLAPTYGLGTREDVARAAALAGEAFGVYRETGPKERGAFLEQVADNIDALGDTLVERVQRETGIVEPRVRGELARTTNQLRLFATLVREGSWVGARIDPALPDRTPLPRPDIRQRKIPLGPVAVFGASNFPLAFSVAGGDTAAALAAGCPVVVKAHSAHPGTSELVAGAIARAVAQHGLPEGVFSMVFGAGREVGITLVTDPHIKAVGFTGSRTAGVALMQAAAARPVPIPVYAEMSSINPVFLLPGALAADTAGLGAGVRRLPHRRASASCAPTPAWSSRVDGPELDAFLAAVADGRPRLPGPADAQRRHPRVVRRRGRPADRRRRRQHGRRRPGRPGHRLARARPCVFSTTADAFVDAVRAAGGGLRCRLPGRPGVLGRRARRRRRRHWRAS